MKTFPELLKDYESIESGTPRLNAMRDGIAQADEQGDLYWRFQMRFYYLKESIFCGDRYFALIIFPQLLALYEENEKIRLDDECDYDMLVAFRWIVEAAPEFPQISKVEIDGYFRLFKQMLLEHGYSLSIYHMKRSLFYRSCNRNIATSEFYKFVDAPLDMISDGKALYNHHKAGFYLYLGNEEKALEAAKPIFDGELIATALPYVTNCEFIEYYLANGCYEKAYPYAQKTERHVTGNSYYLDVVGPLLSLYSIEKHEQGLELFRQNYDKFANSRNPLLRLKFANGAYHLFRALPENYVPAQAIVPKDSELEGMTMPELSAHFYAIANALAAKFDARNGTDDYLKLVNAEYHT